MHVKFGALMTDARGKIGGHVFSSSLGGAVLRTNSIKSKSFTDSQNTIKSRLAQISQLWGTLTATQVKFWNKMASMQTHTNVFGDKKTFTGFAFFQECNNNLLQIGSSTILVPGSISAIPIFTMPAIIATHLGVLTATWTLDPVLTGYKVLVYATAPMPVGRKIQDNNYYCIGLMPTIVAHVVDLSALYLAKFYSISAAGSQIGIAFVPICTTTGGKTSHAKLAITGLIVG